MLKDWTNFAMGVWQYEIALEKPKKDLLLGSKRSSVFAVEQVILFSITSASKKAPLTR